MELGDGTLYLLIRGIQLQSGMTGCFDSSASQTAMNYHCAHSTGHIDLTHARPLSPPNNFFARQNHDFRLGPVSLLDNLASPVPESKFQRILNTCSSNGPPWYLNFFIFSGTFSNRIHPPRPVKSPFASTPIVQNKFHRFQQEIEKSPVYTVTRWGLVI